MWVLLAYFGRLAPCSGDFKDFFKENELLLIKLIVISLCHTVRWGNVLIQFMDGSS